MVLAACNKVEKRKTVLIAAMGICREMGTENALKGCFVVPPRNDYKRKWLGHLTPALPPLVVRPHPDPLHMERVTERWGLRN